jgi:hypothetical protein
MMPLQSDWPFSDKRQLVPEISSKLFAPTGAQSESHGCYALVKQAAGSEWLKVGVFAMTLTPPCAGNEAARHRVARLLGKNRMASRTLSDEMLSK